MHWYVVPKKVFLFYFLDTKHLLSQALFTGGSTDELWQFALCLDDDTGSTDKTYMQGSCMIRKLASSKLSQTTNYASFSVLYSSLTSSFFLFNFFFFFK